MLTTPEAMPDTVLISEGLKFMLCRNQGDVAQRCHRAGRRFSAGVDGRRAVHRRHDGVVHVQLADKPGGHNDRQEKDSAESRAPRKAAVEHHGDKKRENQHHRNGGQQGSDAVLQHRCVGGIHPQGVVDFFQPHKGQLKAAGSRAHVAEGEADGRNKNVEKDDDKPDQERQGVKQADVRIIAA